MDTIETVTVKGEAISLSLLIWRRFKRRMPGYLERVLAMNPGIAESDFLPIGARIRLPIDSPTTTPQRVEVVNLWD